ncbi:hypothetical protein [Pseudoxanthomonas sp. JBR18]|uniref:hypothetical protein n=1 Tax=Pseudoxanthomonas sp. JBR18 TaxID=2969308 RepID=UPI002305C887|nr:hypothetical protein [Pseudoxanthomonas sp. JBR18]WCE04845.1 hypothetical protein PJ250_02300 [Pseudoxanthomonas sp. JBR18]
MSKGKAAAGAVPWSARMGYAFAGALLFAPSMAGLAFGLWRLAHPAQVVWVFHGAGLAVFWLGLCAVVAALSTPLRGLSRTRCVLAGAVLAPVLGVVWVVVYDAR